MCFLRSFQYICSNDADGEHASCVFLYGDSRCSSALQIPPAQPVMNFSEKNKDKPTDLQNFGLRPDLYAKKNLKVSSRLLSLSISSHSPPFHLLICQILCYMPCITTDDL